MGNKVSSQAFAQKKAAMIAAFFESVAAFTRRTARRWQKWLIR